MTLRSIAAPAVLALALSFAAGAAIAADLTVTQTGGGPASAGQTQTFVITASSVSLGLPPSLPVRVKTTLTGMSQPSASGAGWTCAVAGLVVTCTRSDGLTPGAAYPPITVSAVAGSNLGITKTYSSCAVVSHDTNPAVQPDQVAANNTACVSGSINAPKLRPR